MGQCTVCSNRSEEGMGMYRIPVKKGARQELWLKFINLCRPGFAVNIKSNRVCTAHFALDQFDPNRTDRKLKRDAVPTIFNGDPDAYVIHKPVPVLAEDRSADLFKDLPEVEQDLGLPSIHVQTDENEASREDFKVEFPDPLSLQSAGNSSEDTLSAEDDVQGLKDEFESEETPSKKARLSEKMDSAAQSTPNAPTTKIVGPAQLVSVKDPKILEIVKNAMPGQNLTNVRVVSRISPQAGGQQGVAIAPAPFQILNTQATPQTASSVVPPVPVNHYCNGSCNQQCHKDMVENLKLKRELKDLQLQINSLNLRLKAAQGKPLKPKPKIEKEDEPLKRFLNEDQILCLKRKHMSGSMWSQETIKKSFELRAEVGRAGYEMLLKQGYPLPADRTLLYYRKIPRLNAASKDDEKVSEEEVETQNYIKERNFGARGNASNPTSKKVKEVLYESDVAMISTIEGGVEDGVFVLR